jgi:hypothetical protein
MPKMVEELGMGIGSNQALRARRPTGNTSIHRYKGLSRVPQPTKADAMDP